MLLALLALLASASHRRLGTRTSTVVAACRLVTRPARARTLARLTHLAARGPAPWSRAAPSRERCGGAATFAVVAPVVARVATAHRCRRAAMPHPAVAAATLTRVATTTAHFVSAATLTRVATATAHVVTARLNHAAVSRRAAPISPRATVVVATIIVVTTVTVHALKARPPPLHHVAPCPRHLVQLCLQRLAAPLLTYLLT